jgi:outer membrane receptor protein involved in Fe transport
MRLRVVASFVLCASSLLAQAAGGLAGISGVVKDPSGSVVPNAKVEVSSESLGKLRTLNTNEAGLFTVPALVPGAGYKVTVTAAGFAPFEAAGLDLKVGQNLDLPVTLAVTAATSTVDVSATVDLVSDTKTDVSQVIDSKQITDLPINGRRVDSFVLLTPGVTNDGTFGLLTFRGVAGHNSFLVDGNDSTEQFYNENAGRTRIASGLSQDVVQEFQVVSANFSAEYGRAMGGVVNQVTRSGGNSFHGTAYWFYRNQDFNARDTFASFNPDESRHQAGGTLGGPIKKDKLFFLVNTEVTRRNFPMVDSYVRAGVIDPNTHGWIGCGAPATPAQCSAIDALLPRYFGALPRTLDQELYFGKLDYRMSERNMFSASLNYLHSNSPNGIQTGITSTSGAGINSNGDDAVRVRNGRFTWTGIPNNNFVNEFRWGWFTDRQGDTFDNSTLGTGLGFLQASVAGVSLGQANYLPRVEPSEQRFQFVDNATWTKGKHVVKFGADIANTEDYTYFISNFYGNYTYQTVTNFALDYSNAGLATSNVGKHWQTYAQTFGGPVVDATITDYGFYLQDQWRATDRLTVSLGARYEYAQLPQPKLCNPDYPQTCHSPTVSKNLAPRVGLTYRLNDKTVIRAGYGMFHSRFMGSLIDNLFTNNAVLQKSLSLSSTQQAQFAAGPAFPNTLTAPPTGGTASAVSLQFMDPHFRTPYSEQGTLAIERQLTHDMGLTVSYIWSRGIQILGVRDLNLPALSNTTFTYTIADANGSPTGQTYTTRLYLGSRPDTRYGGINQAENGVNSYYNALAVQLRKRFSHGFQADLAYTWAHEIDDGQSNGSGALFFTGAGNWTYNGDYKQDKGNGALDQRHRLVFSFLWQPTITHRTDAFSRYVLNNWQLSAITIAQSGRPTNTFLRTTDTPYPGVFSTSNLDGSGLSSRVPFLPPNSLISPAQYRTDARLSKMIPITERIRGAFYFEVFNLSNSVSYTGITNQVYQEAKGILTLTPTAYGVGSSDGGFPDGTQARRMQIGLRVTF